MSIRRLRRVEKEVKEIKKEVKKEIKKEIPIFKKPVKIEQPKEESTKEIPIESISKISEPLQQIVEPKKVEIAETIKPQKDYNGIGLIGDNDEILKFKVLHKQKRIKIGFTLFGFIKEWNEKNSI